MSSASGNPVRPADWRKVLYDVLVIALTPLIALYPLWLLLFGKRSRAEMAQLFGVLPPELRRLHEDGEPVIWVQAVSAGEVAALGPLLHELHQAEPGAHLVVSTTSDTGLAMARKQQWDTAGLLVFPLDYPGITEHVLDTLRPSLIVLVETEIWPHLLTCAAQRGVRVCIVNARLSDRAFPRYRLFRPFMAWTLRHVDRILTQNQVYRERFLALGARPERVEVVGNYKFDENFPLIPAEEAAKWRQDLGFTQDQPILLAASTHAPEEEIVLRCYERLRGRFPDLGLLLAPRHPDRAEALESLISGHGYRCLRRSRQLAGEGAAETAGGAQTQITVLDTMGELGRVFSIATVVFMGGTLANVGGHNILQPMAQGKPVLFGPHMQNQRDFADVALAEEAALLVRTPEQLEAALERLLGSETERQILGLRGQNLLRKHEGAARSMALRLAPLIDQP